METKNKGSKGCDDKLKKAEDDIVNLNIQVEKGKKIVDCLETKLHDKTIKCSKLEEEIVPLRKELENAKEWIDKSLKIKGGNDLLDEVLYSQKPQKDEGSLGLRKENLLIPKARMRREKKSH